MNSMQQRPSISYAICVRNEENFSSLIRLLHTHKDNNDEIVVISDFSKSSVYKDHLKLINTFVKRKLLYDFASHKNLFFEFCKGEYIFNLDADELPSVSLLTDIKKIILKDRHDLYTIPRINLFGKNSSTKVTDHNVLDISKSIATNFPDSQGRIYVNSKKLMWTRKLHEYIVGTCDVKKLKISEKYYLIHRKTVNEQKNSNLLYKNFNITKSKSELGIVCCYFNPFNYKSRFHNFLEFYFKLKEDGFNPLVVESYTDKSRFRINNIVQNIISTKHSSLYWYKESLLNKGIRKLLKQKYKYIMWCDADIIFKTENWWNNVILSTEHYGVSQIFCDSKKRNDNSYFSNKKSIAFTNTFFNKKTDLLKMLKRTGEPGYGCCYKREYLEANLLYDKCIVGGGDLINLLGFYSEYDIEIYNDRFFNGTTESFKLNFMNWAKKNKQIKHGIGYANNKIEVLQHGSMDNRKYLERENIIKKGKFDPNKHLEKKKNRIELVNSKLEKLITTYMQRRNEDENFKPYLPDEIYGFNKIFCEDSVYKKLQFNKKKNFKNYKTQNNKYIVAMVRVTEKPVILPTHDLFEFVLIDSGYVGPSLKSICHIENKNIYGIYFDFIYNLYDNLPKYCFFLNNSHDLDLDKIINRINLQTLAKNKIHHFHGNTRKTNLAVHKKVHNYKSPYVWWKETFNGTFSNSNTYNTSNNFVVDVSIIKKRDKLFYKKLATECYENRGAEVLCHHAILNIFK